MSARALAVLLSALVVVVLALAHDVAPLQDLDRNVSTWVAEDLPEPLRWVARPLSWLGGWIGLVGLGVAALALLVRERAWLDLGFFLAAFAGSQLVVAVVKELVDRPRPDVGSAVALPTSASFPSGHATAGVASLGAIAILAAERIESPRARRALWVGVVLVGVAVGVSRVALNVHFVTDVVAGFGFGLAWLAACLLVRDAIARRRRKTVAQSH